jgi:thiopurine S-methyltransferase
MELNLNNQYWNSRYIENQTGWDIGYPSPSFIEYFKDIDRNSKILIPGCGNSYEGEALYQMGFNNITLLDFAATSKENFLNRCPQFPTSQFVVGDFFALDDQFDFILEQTFFCALNPKLRNQYLVKMSELLYLEGKLVGLLFDAPLNTDHPPFGGARKEYEILFKKHFSKVSMTSCENSIDPRQGKELWIEISN